MAVVHLLGGDGLPARRNAVEPSDPLRHTEPMGQRMSCPVFVGRTDEMAGLQAAFEAARAGRTSAVLLTGEAGIGKSRLVEEFVVGARAAGARVAKGACVPVDGGATPYGPFVALFDDLGRQLDEPDAAELLGPLAAGLTSSVVGRRGGGPSRDGAFVAAGPRPMLDEVTKTRLLELELTSLRAVADRAPLVLVFEDVQWADSATADLLGFLIRNLADAAVLFVCTCRADEIGRDHGLHGWMREMRRAPQVAVVALPGLDRPQVADLVDGILGHTSQWTLAEAVWGRSQGNPFFVEELVAAREVHDLPPELQAVILGRVAELSDPAQRVLRLAAVVGASVDHDLLVAMADDLDGASDGPADPDRGEDRLLEQAIEELVDQQVLVVEPSRTGYRFRHALTREAVEGAILPGERRRLHRRAALALAAGSTGAGAAELAAHWWAAEAWTETLAASVVAADAAAEVWAYPEVLAHLERAEAAIDKLDLSGPDAADRALDGVGLTRLALLWRAGDAAYLAGRTARSVELARRLVDRYLDHLGWAATGEPGAPPPGAAQEVVDDLARAYVALGRNAWAVGDAEAAFEAYRRAAELVPDEPPSAALARIRAEQARSLMLMSRFAEATERCHQAIDVAREVGARAEEGHALCTLACCRGNLGFYAEGIELLRQAMTIAEELQDPDDLSRAYTNLSNLLMEFGRLAEVADLLHDSAAVGEALWGVRLNGAAGNAVEALVRLGRYPEAAHLLDQVGEGTLSGACAPSPFLLPAPMVIRTGRFEEADRLLEQADAIIGDFPDVQQRGTYLLLAGELALARGEAEHAYELAQRGLEHVSGSDDILFTSDLMALAVQALADQYEASQVDGRPFDLDKGRLLAAGLVDEVELLVVEARARGGEPPPRVVAHAAQAGAERSRLHAPDPGAWSEAATAWQRANETHAVAWCRWREAEARLAGRPDRTERARAAEALSEAWRLSLDLGARPLQGRIEALARRARIDLGADRADDDPTGSDVGSDLGITPREVEVLRLLAAGRTDGEIADALFISKKTASVHVSNLLRKLAVANRLEAGRIGQAHGLG